MDRQQAEAAIEALLFAMGDSVPASDLAHALELDEGCVPDHTPHDVEI